MALREGVVELLEDHVGGIAIEQQHGNRSFLVATILGDGAQRLELGFHVQARGDGPAGFANACFTCSSVPASMRLVMSEGLGGFWATV